MDYEISIQKRKGYVHINVKQNFTKPMAEQFMTEATALGEQKGIHNLILDIRGVSSESSIADKYTFAHNGGKSIGLTRSWKTVLLADEETEDLKFMETAMRNSGFNYRLLVDEKKAIAWLKA